MSTVTREQSMKALAGANRIRLERARIKRALRAGTDLGEFLLDPPEALLSAPLEEILRALPMIGPNKATQLCRRASVSPLRRVGELTERQRLLILAAVSESPAVR